MIDWRARAAAVLQKTPTLRTDETDETPSQTPFVGFVGTSPHRFRENTLVPQSANDEGSTRSERWRVRFADRNPTEVTFSEPVGREYVLEFLSAVGAEPFLNSPEPPRSCTRCRYVSGFGNCTEPVAAGRAKRFMLVKHPDGGQGCGAFVHMPLAIESRLAELLALGAIDADAADLCRRRYSTDSATWDLFLDACESEVTRRP